METPEIPSIQIGRFNISRYDEDSVWIECDDGEGGQFADRSIISMLEKFYNEHF